MADDSRSAADSTVEHATCLGCGCACDDITVVVRAGRIAEARRACAVGMAWFGDGSAPAGIRVAGAADGAGIAAALERAATCLARAERPLVYLAAECSCESQRAAIAIADVLGAALDSVTSATAGPAILAAQRRGRSGATLGEIRNRADMMLFWGVDPAVRYPRYASRYAPEPQGLYVPRGRPDRTIIAVDIGADRGPVDADVRVRVTPEEEVVALDLVRAALLGRPVPRDAPDSLPDRAAALAERLRAGRYLAVVADGEPTPGRDRRRSEALILLVEALNATSRAALSTLRAGGNRSGADAVMTWQTGYPMTVDFARGSPHYQPEADATAILAAGDVDVALIAGSSASLPDTVRAALGDRVQCIVIGPRATETQFATQVAIDTGVPGIHEGGSAVRMDDVMLPLRPALAPLAQDSCITLGALARMVARMVGVA